MSPAVDLVVNTFERNYRTVLEPGYLARIAAENRFGFARRVLLVNNVEDRDEVLGRADALLRAGEIDEYHEVAKLLPGALSAAGLSERELGRLIHYSDCSLAAITLAGSPWLLYWDPDVRLEEPCDWVTPCVERMEEDRTLAVANPLWEDATLASTTLRFDGDFAIGRGFSDQVYLVRRADFAAPIYGERCLARYRYPVSAVCDVFEARVDSWMRHNGRMRLTYLPARYLHPVRGEGSATEHLTNVERVRRLRNHAVLALLAVSPWKPDCCRLM